MHLIIESHPISGVSSHPVVKTEVHTLSEFKAAVLAAPNGACFAPRKNLNLKWNQGFGFVADFFVRDGKVLVVAGNRRFDYLLRVARIPRMTWEEYFAK